MMRLVLATLAAAVLVVAFLLAVGAAGPEYIDGPSGEPSDTPSGEQPVPCAEDDRACNEWIDVQEPDR